MAFNYLPARLHTLKTKCLNPDQARQIRPDHYSNNLTIIEFLRSFEPVECEIIMSGFKVVVNYVLSVVIKYGVEIISSSGYHLTCVLCSYLPQIIWTQTRLDKASGLIWIQTIRH